MFLKINGGDGNKNDDGGNDGYVGDSYVLDTPLQ